MRPALQYVEFHKEFIWFTVSPRSLNEPAKKALHPHPVIEGGIGSIGREHHRRRMTCARCDPTK